MCSITQIYAILKQANIVTKVDYGMSEGGLGERCRDLCIRNGKHYS